MFRSHPSYTLLTALITVAALGAGSCSSLPADKKAPVPESDDGGGFMLQGASQARRGERARAAATYRLAYDKFTMGDDVPGKVRSALALSKLAHAFQQDSSEFEWLTRARRLIIASRPDLASELLLTQVELAFADAAYDSVLSLTASLPPTLEKFDLELYAELISYRLMSRVQVGIGSQAAPTAQAAQVDYAALKMLYPQLVDQHRRTQSGDILVQSFAAYVLGYTDMKRGGYGQASQWFELSMAIDRQMSHYRGTAENLYGLGASAEALQKTGAAQSYFERASEIYERLGDRAAADRAEVKSISLLLRLSLSPVEPLLARLSEIRSRTKALEPDIDLLLAAFRSRFNTPKATSK